MLFVLIGLASALPWSSFATLKERVFLAAVLRFVILLLALYLFVD